MAMQCTCKHAHSFAAERHRAHSSVENARNHFALHQIIIGFSSLDDVDPRFGSGLFPVPVVANCNGGITILAPASSRKHVSG